LVFYDILAFNYYQFLDKYYQKIKGKLIGLQKATTHFCWHKTQSRAMMQRGMVKKI
jgi:hypothetical protein